MTRYGRGDPQFDWQHYYETIGKTENPVVKESVACMLSSQRRGALDLGAGSLIDAKYLRDAGFSPVIAVDHTLGFGEEEVMGIECVWAPLEEYQPPTESFDLIICLNTLPYVSKRVIEKLVRKAYFALRPGGFFLFNLMGTLDCGAHEEDVTAYGQLDIDMLCERYGKKIKMHQDLLMGESPSSISERTHVYHLAIKKP